MKKLNNQGFGAIEIVLIIVVIGILGFVGYRAYSVYTSNPETGDAESRKFEKKEIDKEEPKEKIEEQVSEQPKAASQPKTTSSKLTAVSEPAFGYKYSYSKANKCLRAVKKPKTNDSFYKDGERINNDSVDCGLYISPFSLSVYVSGSAADSGRDYKANMMKDNDSFSLKSKQNVTKNGKQGTRWEYQPKDKSNGRIIFYYFKSGNYAYDITINDNGNGAGGFDIAKRGEDIYSTFEFTN